MDIFFERRKKLADSLPEGSITVIHSANQKIRNGDTDYSFRQDSDFLYLTNFNEADAALIIEKKGNTIFHLFCAEKDELREKWEGPRLGPENVSQLGFESGYKIDDLILKTVEFLGGAEHLFCQNKSQKKLFFALSGGLKGKKIDFDLMHLILPLMKLWYSYYYLDHNQNLFLKKIAFSFKLIPKPL